MQIATTPTSPLPPAPCRTTERYQVLKEVLRKQFMELPNYQHASCVQRIAMLAHWDAVFDQMVDEKAAERRAAEARLQ